MVIRLAANYSQPLLTLIDEQPGIVSAVKVSEFDRPEYVSDYASLLALGIPLVLHGLAQNVTPGTPAFRREFAPANLRSAVSVCRPQYVSVHLEWRSREAFPGRDAFLRELARDLDAIRELTGLPVAIENIFSYRVVDPAPDRANFNPPLISDPEFICEAVASTGAGFLLDIGHAQVAAWHRGESPESYVRRLPLAAVQEIHVSGPAAVDGVLRDRHVEVEAEGYALLATALRLCAPQTISLEYGGVGPVFAGKSDPAVLLRQLVQLRSVIAEAADSPAAGEAE